MAFVLTTASRLICPHSGTLVLTTAGRLLTVDGQPVIVESDLRAATFTPGSCTNVGGSLTPCTNINSITAGLSSTLSAGGEPVALDTVQGLTNSTPPAPFQVVTAGQTKLEASR
jgi:hypothetical protein